MANQKNVFLWKVYINIYTGNVTLGKSKSVFVWEVYINIYTGDVTLGKSEKGNYTFAYFNKLLLTKILRSEV